MATDFYGIGILLGIFLTVAALLFVILIVLVVCLVEKRKSGKSLSEQPAFILLRTSLIFLAVNTVLLPVVAVIYKNISHEIKRQLNEIMLLGYPLLNLFAVCFISLLSKKN